MFSALVISYAGRNGTPSASPCRQTERRTDWHNLNQFMIQSMIIIESINFIFYLNLHHQRVTAVRTPLQSEDPAKETGRAMKNVNDTKHTILLHSKKKYISHSTKSHKIAKKYPQILLVQTVVVFVAVEVVVDAVEPGQLSHRKMFPNRMLNRNWIIFIISFRYTKHHTQHHTPTPSPSPSWIRCAQRHTVPCVRLSVRTCREMAKWLFGGAMLRLYMLYTGAFGRAIAAVSGGLYERTTIAATVVWQNEPIDNLEF